jgi:NADH-quinone oxidoreductase subunit J
VSAVLFFIAAIFALTGAIGVVMLRNPFYSVLALVVHLISLAALFLLLEAQFVAAAQVVVYAGAVMVLYVFVVAYIGGADQPLGSGADALKVLGPIFALAVAIELCIAMLGSALEGISSKGVHLHTTFGTPRDIGRLFLTSYLLPFELASLLLMVAAVGAVVLARRRRGLEADEDEYEYERGIVAQHRPLYTGTNAETTGVRRHVALEAEAEADAEAAEAEAERDHAASTSSLEGGW